MRRLVDMLWFAMLVVVLTVFFKSQLFEKTSTAQQACCCSCKDCKCPCKE